MSPVARSLLALAALLASANCDADNCAYKEMGQKTNSPIVFPTVHVPEPRKDVTPENACSPGAVNGETIRACSHIDGCTPTIKMAEGTYSPIDVECPCPGGCEVDITQYC